MKIQVNNKTIDCNYSTDQFGRTIDSSELYNKGLAKVKVGMFINHFGYSDVTPYEIVGVNKSGKTIKVREMDAKLVDGWKPEILEGGFSGHCANNRTQEYTYKSNKNNPTFILRKSKIGFGKGKYKVSSIPRRFYDYNF